MTRARMPRQRDPRALDLLVVGAGPAGAATAIGALRADPDLRVALLDRATFPRDKACGDGIAPHVLDLLAQHGVTGLLDDWTPVTRLRLRRGALEVDREMRAPAYVVPREVFDARLVSAALRAGAMLVQHRVRALSESPDAVGVDDRFRAAVVVGADGASSVVRRHLGRTQQASALAIRGYVPTDRARAGAQVIAFGTGVQPSYAWAFDCGDGTSNVGYGELLAPDRQHPTRTQLLHRLEDLLPGTTLGAERWRAHHLPLSSRHGAHPGRGRLLLVGDAAGLVNPMTGEGIYYAVATGLLAGRAVADALRDGTTATVAARHARDTEALLGRHLRHTDLAARLCRSGRVLDGGLRVAAREQAVFDDLVELGLARGRITPLLARRLVGGVTLGRFRGRHDAAARPPHDAPASAARPHPEENP